MTSFGCVPLASVCPCARCVEAITSPSSSARQTPTATASWPIATCRKPGSSPARKRSSTFSSKRRMSSISRRKSFKRSLPATCSLSSSLATRGQRIDTPLDSRAVKLAEQWDELVGEFPPDWSDLYAEVQLDSSDFLQRGALLLAPVNPARHDGPTTLRFRAARLSGYGVAASMARRSLERLDREHITGRLRILQVLSATSHVATQGPVWRVG